MILLIDDLFTDPLAAELSQLESDLAGDGWKILRDDVSRTNVVTSVKDLVTAEYNADPENVKAVFIIGHVPVPYSGSFNPDAHMDHYGAWPADVYYGDIARSGSTKQ